MAFIGRLWLLLVLHGAPQLILTSLPHAYFIPQSED
jgi:hypothetical protein